MIVLYNGTDGDNWLDNSGWKTPPLDADGFAMPGTENTWFGVTVAADAVTELRFEWNDLHGNIPPELEDLSSLEVLDLPGNILYGSIPAELGNLSNLKYLDLSDNYLENIPPELRNLNKLEKLILYYNNLSGNIPAELGNLSSLIELNLSYNGLTGSIPWQLGNLNSLIDLNLSYNGLTGSIPPQLGNLTNLKTLELCLNELSGNLPPELGGLIKLEELYLYYNYLTGSIPAELGTLTNLWILALSDNELSGSIPPQLGNLIKVEGLYLYENYLTGNIPPELGNLNSLTDLDLCENELSGSIPPQLGDLDNLVYLYLDDNYLTGNIPIELGNLGNLQYLDLYHNFLTGSIPPELGNLNSLIGLDLCTNELSGSIPPQLGNLGNLEYLDLWANSLTGSIPPELGNLGNLETLYLDENSLSGSIPASLGNLNSLDEIWINSNMLSGEVPAALTNLVNLYEDYSNFGWNALYTDDPAVKAFLDSKQDGGNWEGTQTILPKNIHSYGSYCISYISWNPILYTGDTGGYYVYYSETSGGPYTYLGKTQNKSASFFSLEGLQQNSEYYFVVQTRTEPHDDNYNVVLSGFSDEIYVNKINTITYPGLVVNTGAGVNEGENVTITDGMLNSTDPNGADLSVRYYVNTPPAHGTLFIIGEPNLKIETDNINITAFTQNDLHTGKVSYQHNGDNSTNDSFTFTLVDTDGEESQEYTFNITINQMLIPPLPPTGLVITFNLLGEPVLTWNPVSDASGINILRNGGGSAKLDQITSYEIIATLSGDAETYTDETTSEGANYGYRIEAFNDNGYSGVDEGEGGGTAEILTPLHTPTGMMANANEDGSITLTWNDNSSIEDGYIVARKTGSTGTYGIISTLGENMEVYIDANLVTGETYYYCVKAYNSNNESVYSNECNAMSIITGIDEWQQGAPVEFTLHQNYPNPFNPTTTIRYELPEDSYVRIAVYNMLGQQVELLLDQFMSAGFHELTFEAEGLNSGIYLYKIDAGSYSEIKKCILIK